MDEVIELPKPGLPERARLIRQYFSAYLHHDPPTDFLRLPAPAASTAASTGTRAVTARSGGVAARWDQDEHSSSGRDARKPTRATHSLHAELEGGTEGSPPVEQAGTSERGNGGRGGRACDGAVRMSEGFRDTAPRLISMLAVRSEGFYGRDMEHFFSAVQVRRRAKRRTTDSLRSLG